MKKVPTQVQNYQHSSNRRANLPTDQTSRFMPDGDRAPVEYRPPLRTREGPVLAWDRDPALDDPCTAATPLYIQEKHHPAAFAESLQSRGDSGQMGMFHAFNNLPEKAAFEWYRHQGNWQNRIIRGESRHVMASLLAKESMAGQVQTIFFDPPYGISFKSNMQANARKRGDAGTGTKAVPNEPTVIRTFRDTYQNGIHSYLDNIYRIALHARELLHDSGSFFVQIGSANVHRLAVLLDETFGPENRIATIAFSKSGSTSASTLPEVADYLLWYAKDRDSLQYFQLYEPLTRAEKIEHMSSYAMVELADGADRKLTTHEREDPAKYLAEGASIYQQMPLSSPGVSTTGRSEPHPWNDTTYPCPPGEQWRVSPEGLDHLEAIGRLASSGERSRLRWKRYEDEIPGRLINNLWDTKMSPTDLHYVVETAESVIERCILMTTAPGDLVLDPTCGSGTTAYVAEKWGRRWITSDASMVAASLARQRLATGTFDYHLLKDSAEGTLEEHKLQQALVPDESTVKTDGEWSQDPAKGFVYERVRNVSAAKLAYDEDIEATLLVNRPLRKRGVVRVSSPFTIESHSPYRVVDPESLAGVVPSDNVCRTIIETLTTTGIGSGARTWHVKNIENYPSVEPGVITHTGWANDTLCAIMVVSEDVTVGAHLINVAAEQAANLPSVQKLLIVAFAFEADARSSETERRGRLSIHKIQANQDLRVGNLAARDADHAFTLIGEPDIRITQSSNNPEDIMAEVVGYDTYNPATGQLDHRGTGNRDIQCWMIDTNYDGRSFFAQRIHFPGSRGDRQVERFKRTLGRRVDPSLWASMQSCKSAPFPRPNSGRIAIRIVTNTHTEMTTVITV